MWRLPWIALAALCACGRLEFGLYAGASAGSGIDAAAADASADSIAAQIPPGAGVWLRMETDPSAGIIDSAGGHAVSCTTSCPTRVPGVHGSAYAFSSQALAVTYAPDLDASAGFTAALWVRIDADPAANACPYGKSFDTADGWDMFVFGIYPDGTSFFDGESTTGVTSTEAGPLLSLGIWHHLAMTWDGTTRRDYQDGVQVGSDLLVTGTSSDDIAVGGSPGYWFTGALDDVVFYARVLSDQEIAQLATP